MRDERRRWLPCALLLAACTASVEPEGSSDATRCAPSTTRSCPCFGSGMGSQVCDDSGDRYGACIGCIDGAAGARSSTAPLDESGATPGVACGVALPVLCTPERETCCIRSLSPDSCIDSATPCACSTPGCQATTLRCDGPEDCSAGQACCGTPLDGASGYSSFACAARCLSDEHEACHAGRAACPAGLVCTNSQFLTNMQLCVDPASLAQ